VPEEVAFFGYGELGLAGLQTLLSIGAPVSNVIVPGNRSGPGVDLVREAAARCALPVLVQPPRRDIGPFVDTLRGVRPDLIIVCSYSMMLPPAVLAVPAKGAVNVHGGLLPQYRGGHVTQWAIINAEREFGVTLHYIDEGVDTGPVIAERRFALDEADDAYTVGAKLREVGSQLLTTWWPRLIDGTAPRVPQDESRAKYWPLRTPEEGRITWTMSAPAICRLVRALCANSPGAYVQLPEHRIRLRRALALPSLDRHAQPGEVVTVDADAVRVAAADGDVLIMAAVDMEGQRLAPGTLAELFAHARA
jgi:methionyl-tRNA formyltransferase